MADGIVARECIRKLSNFETIFALLAADPDLDGAHLYRVDGCPIGGTYLADHRAILALVAARYFAHDHCEGAYARAQGWPRF